MSKMEELTKKLENDTAFVAELKQASSAEELAAKLKAAGFHITPEELLQVLTPAESDELSDDELNTVAGGLTLPKEYRESSVAQDLLENQAKLQQSIAEAYNSPSLEVQTKLQQMLEELCKPSLGEMQSQSKSF